MRDELAIGDVLFRQKSLRNVARLTRSYDLVIAGLSWEARGTAALARISLQEAATPLVLLKFRSPTAAIDTEKLMQLAEFKGLMSNVSVKSLESSTDAQANFLTLKAWLQDQYAAAGKPLSILVDITCLPKTYVLFLLGLGFREELFARFDCLYTPGLYDLVSSTSTSPVITGPRALLSEGEWSSRQIPYLEASEYIASDLDLLVSLGGELGLSLPFIERFEPRRLGLVFIEETSPESPTQKLLSNTSML